MNLILQPCSNKTALLHYSNTIENSNLNLNLIKSYLSKTDYQNLLDIFNQDCIHVWGVTKSSNAKWNRMNIGDVALFSKSGVIFSYGIVCYKVQNSNLAEFLWGKDKQNKTWEYIYFLTELKTTNITYLSFNNAVGYNDKYVIQGFNVLDDEKTAKFLNKYPIFSETYIPEVKESEYLDVINNPLDNLETVDSKVLSNQRIEQNFLRRQLFKNKTHDRCSICGEDMPISFLCCSHIKKRCMCSLDEKKDYKNIVTPMCKFGCDDLYEKGLIGVKDGKVVVINYTNSSYINSKINQVKDRSVYIYNDNNKKYFNEHLRSNKYKDN